MSMMPSTHTVGGSWVNKGESKIEIRGLTIPEVCPHINSLL